MSNYTAYLEMSTMFEKLRLQLRFRELITKLGEDQALDVILEAYRLEFHSDQDTARPEPDQAVAKKVPVSCQ